MINLLPPDIKQDITYARRNRRLVRWIVALLFLIGGVASITIFGQLYINRAATSHAVQVEQSRQQLKLQQLEETQAQVENISSSLKLAVDVLSREVLFSKLLRQIGAAMPAGATLSGISIEKIEGGLDLTAAAADYRSASQIQVNLQDPANQIFEKADIDNITCEYDNPPDPRYPCNITIRALFGDNSPFLYISESPNPRMNQP
jgi:hypothetical protein